MKSITYFFVTCLFAGFVLADGSNEAVPLTDGNIPYLYESRAEVAAPDYVLASIISYDYRRARDEFTKHDLFLKIKPALENRLNEARKTTRVSIRVATKIGEYDFKKSAFPTGFSESTFLPFSHHYAGVFLNSKEMLYLDVPLEKARTFSSSLRKSRKGTMIITATIVAAKEKSISSRHGKALMLHVDEFKLVHDSGEEFGVRHIGEYKK